MIQAFVLLMAVQAAVLPPPASRASPRMPLESYISDSDYPASARERREQGTVTFDLAIGADGRVTSCTIAASSGSSMLDNTTCRIMRSRARFTPAFDHARNAVADSGRAGVHWTLDHGTSLAQPFRPSAAGAAIMAAASGPVVEPARARANLAAYVSNDDYPLSAVKRGEQGTVRFRLDVGEDGRVAACSITGSSGSSTLDNTTCRLMRSRARFTPAVDAHGRGVRDSVASALTWRIRTPPPSPAK